MVRRRRRRRRNISFSDPHYNDDDDDDNNNNNNNCEFFKVYLPSFSAHQLGIPPAFVRHLNGTTPKHVILRDYDGRQWHGRVEEHEGSWVIKDCWEKFAIDHTLEHGDFLIFKYNGSSLFDVKIFGINGCLKEETLSAKTNTTHVKKEMETEVKQTSGRGDRTGKQKYSESILKTNEELGGPSGERQVKRLKRDSINLGEEKDFKAAGCVVPKNPHFVSTLTRYSRYLVNISLVALRSKGIKLMPDMMLRDQNGKKWPVKIIFRENGRKAISGGWSNFRKRHKLDIGDKCIFEFVLGKGNICKEMKVQVVRKNATKGKHNRGSIKKA